MNIIAMHGVFYEEQRDMDAAAEEWGIQYPYVNDPERQTWEAYELFSHPSYALINPDGSLHESSSGVVATDSTIEWIEAHLNEAVSGT